jgi:hypothetical protein
MSLGRRLVRKNQILIQYVLLDLFVDWVADDERIVQPERREPFFRWIAPSLEPVACAEELRGLGWVDSPLFLLGLWFGLGPELLIALGDARTGGRRLRGMALLLGRLVGGRRRGPSGRRWTLWLLCHGLSPVGREGFARADRVHPSHGSLAAGPPSEVRHLGWAGISRSDWTTRQEVR